MTNQKNERKKLIILGTADSMNRTPFDNDEYDYWACSPVLSYDNVKNKRIDVVFEMHEKTHWQNEKITKMLNAFIKLNSDSIIYMQDVEKTIKNSKKYPLEEIRKKVNNDFLSNYFTSTIAYMVALAVTLYNYEKIELWGCNMAAEEEEYSRQRSAVESWLAYGLGKRIAFWIPPDSEVFKSGSLYGYEQKKDRDLRILSIKNDVATGVEHYRLNLAKAQSEYDQQKGGLRMMEMLIRELKIK